MIWYGIKFKSSQIKKKPEKENQKNQIKPKRMMFSQRFRWHIPLFDKVSPKGLPPKGGTPHPTRRGRGYSNGSNKLQSLGTCFSFQLLLKDYPLPFGPKVQQLQYCTLHQPATRRMIDKLEHLGDSFVRDHEINMIPRQLAKPVGISPRGGEVSLELLGSWGIIVGALAVKHGEDYVTVKENAEALITYSNASQKAGCGQLPL
jgi:hypothetical protein